MATISAVPNGTTLTPPSSSHGPEAWNEKSSPTDMFRGDEYSNVQNGLHSQLGNTAYGSDSNSLSRNQGNEGGLLSPPYIKEARPRSIKDTTSPADSLVDLYANSQADGAGDAHKRAAAEVSGNDSSDDSSKWIHRDKLAKIESEELQAAGIIIPRASRSRSKSQSRPRREQSQDKSRGRAADQPKTRSRNNSEIASDQHRPQELSTVPSWDLRLPEEIAEEGSPYFIPHNLTVKGSKIPVAKTSPLPIPAQHIERDMPIPRKRDGSPSDEETIAYPKTRTRSGSLGNPISGGVPSANAPASSATKRSPSDASPRKPGARKMSGKSATGTVGRPKTRGGPSGTSTSSGTGTRPSTRSGELSSTGPRQMEGEPPWMISAYRPDPRLPPDQQLLPTVARRLQQEKWEREGKFGNIYDKDFRPLTDEGFLKPPEPVEKNAAGAEEPAEEEKTNPEWPLKPEHPKSPSLQHGKQGSYSTMPTIKDPPHSPMPSPRTPGQPLTQVASIVRVPDAPEAPKEESKKDGGCGCCIVM